MNIKTSLSVHAVTFLYNVAFRLFPFAVYTRQPFVRYPYMHLPSQVIALTNLLWEALRQTKGAVIEIGCNQGWTSCFLLEAMKEQNQSRPYVCLDTFTGFTKEDVAAEGKRGQDTSAYEEFFLVNSKKWIDGSLRRFGYSNARSIQADCTKIDYPREVASSVAFCLIDVDLYRPVQIALPRILETMEPGGIIVVDDCDKDHKLWNGAHQAYVEFCQERKLPVEIVAGKLGVVRVTAEAKRASQNINGKSPAAVEG